MSEFLDTIKEIRRGETLTELDDELVGLVAQVRMTGRPGKLTYTVLIKPASKGNVDTLLIEDAITIKTPKSERGSTILFATASNTLQRQDPRQPELSGLRDVVSMRQTSLAERKDQAV